ncbi:hypothetical protein [Streptomyces sp. AC512_CC834]|uniref:hypothetical protein n=1 Tax=Streptomyces sp. AC512_CC834 TaxID=2823691 RepID=UPI001C256487|nr:hypothetical protein [Streptomyces sp. AC512_CC834]
MTEPIPDAQRKEVVSLARSGLSRNEVARRTGVSTASVSRIAKTAGVSFDRTATSTAVEARVIDLKAARVHLAGNLLDDVAAARARLHHTTEPRDFFDLARSVGVLTNAHVRLVGVDGPPDEHEEARGMVGALAQALGVVWAKEQKATADEAETTEDGGTAE